MSPIPAFALASFVFAACGTSPAPDMAMPTACSAFPEAEWPVGSFPQSVAVSDLDGDGEPDLVVANGLQSRDTVSVLLNRGGGGFANRVDYATGSRTVSTGSNSVAMAVGDLNGDGKPDLAVANFVSDTVSVLLNQGGGTFAASVDYATGAGPSSVAMGDLNGDGRPDLAVANDFSATISVLFNLGGGVFAAKVDYATGPGPGSLALGELNGDGKPDLAVINRGESVDPRHPRVGGNTVSVFLNQGGGTFAAKVDYATGAGPVSLGADDLNGDGKPDLAVLNSMDGTVSVFGNQGGGTFAAKVDYAAGVASSMAVGDLNGDGKPDIAVTGWIHGTGGVSVLLNQGGTFAAKVDYAAGGALLSVAIGDLNGDHEPDLAVGAGGANSGLSGAVIVLLNRGRGTFATRADYDAGPGPASVAVGDLNGDGQPDLAIVTFDTNTLRVLLNQGGGTFAAKGDYATGSGPVSVAIGDLNGDGKPDLAAANGGGGTGSTVSVLLNQGDGTLAAKVDYVTGSGPESVAIGDLNGDGKPDLAVTNAGQFATSAGDGHTVSVLLNQGDGTFAAKVDYDSGPGPRSLRIGDLSGDGRPDLVVANPDDGTVSVLVNHGDGTFAGRVQHATGLGAWSVAVGDLNGDGKPDLAVASFIDSDSNTVSVLINQGGGRFAAKVDYATGYVPVSVAMGDLNGDGRHDLAVANDFSATVSVLLNRGDGTFADKVDYATGSGPVSVAVDDLNGNGRLDLAVVNHGSDTVSVLLDRCD